ncbi:hypothetical protein [Mycobacterium shottsii]|nr:hypothetical protein [Mycobacterium shottsii]
MRILVNLGYGDPNYGYSTSPANVPTPFGLFPDVNYLEVAGMLADGTQQGGNAFIADISAMAPSFADLPTSLASAMGSAGTAGTGLLAAAPTSANEVIRALQDANTAIANSIANASSNAYAVLLPTADIANMLVTSMPSYDISLFLDVIEQIVDGDPLGGLTYALVAPLAANTAIVTLASGFQLIVLQNTVDAILGG